MKRNLMGISVRNHSRSGGERVWLRFLLTM
jgi:hypothetical protein